MYEWLPWTGGKLDEVPKNKEDRIKFLRQNWGGNITPEERKNLIKWYGKEHGENVKYAESFEVCEYGKQPSEEEIKQLFPMLDHK